MLGMARRSRTEKVKNALGEAISYTDELIRDERLRAHVRAAVGHGAQATGRVRGDFEAGNVASRLAADKKLRKNIRALLDDLDSAGDRLRRKRRHRARNAVLIVAGTGAAIAVIPNVRRWIAASSNGAMDAVAHAT
jgi:hypothetical protein